MTTSQEMPASSPAATAPRVPLVEMRNIRIAFGGVHAVDGVTVDLFEHRGPVNPWVRERVHTPDLFDRPGHASASAGDAGGEIGDSRASSTAGRGGAGLLPARLTGNLRRSSSSTTYCSG